MEEKQNGFARRFGYRKQSFGLLVIQLLWYILRKLSTLVSVKVVDIYLHFGEKVTNDGGIKNPLFDGLTHIIIPLLHHFTLSGQKNVQNMPRYYTVEQGKNTGWKRSDKTAEPNYIFE